MACPPHAVIRNGKTLLGAARGELAGSPPVPAARGFVPVESQAGIRAHETRCVAFPSGVRRGSLPRGTQADSGAVTHPSSLTVAGAAQESRQGRSPVSRLSRPKIRRGHLKSGMEFTTKPEPDFAIRRRGGVRARDAPVRQMLPDSDEQDAERFVVR